MSHWRSLLAYMSLRLSMSVANYLTFGRIFISPVFLLLYIEAEWLGISPVLLPYVLLGLLTVSELSDFMDGYLARRMGQVTDLGKILDPMADSIYRISIFLAFTTGVVQIPIALVFIFIYRDSVISGLRTICALRGLALAARPSGKLKAGIQAAVAFIIVLAMIPESLGWMETQQLQLMARWLVGGAGFYALATGIEYIYANRVHVVALLKLPDEQEKDDL